MKFVKLFLIALLVPFSLFSQGDKFRSGGKTLVVQDTTMGSRNYGRIMYTRDNEQLWLIKQDGARYQIATQDMEDFELQSLMVDTLKSNSTDSVFIAADLVTLQDVLFNQSSGDVFYLTNAAGDTVFTFDANTDSTNMNSSKFVITSVGNVGIRTASPDHLLDVSDKGDFALTGVDVGTDSTVIDSSSIFTTGTIEAENNLTIGGKIDNTQTVTSGANTANMFRMNMTAANTFTGTTGHQFKVYDADNSVVHSGGEHCGIYVNMKQLSAMANGGKSVLFSGHNYGSGGDYQVIDAADWRYGNFVDGYKISGGSIVTGIDLSETTVTSEEILGSNGENWENISTDGYWTTNGGIIVDDNVILDNNGWIGTSSTNCWTFDGTNMYSSDGNVGIGTISTNAITHILGTTEQLRIGYDATNYVTHTIADDGAYTITTVDADAAEGDIILMPDGNVGIGTDVPIYALDINGDMGVTEKIRSSSDTNTWISFEYSDVIQLICGGVIIAKFVESDQDYVKFGDGTDIDINLNDMMFVQGSDGNVGIGTEDPDAALHVFSATDPQLILTHTDKADSATFGVDSDGDLTITPSGGDVNIVGDIQTGAVGENNFLTDSTYYNATITGETTLTNILPAGYYIDKIFIAETNAAEITNFDVGFSDGGGEIIAAANVTASQVLTNPALLKVIEGGGQDTIYLSAADWNSANIQIYIKMKRLF